MINGSNNRNLQVQIESLEAMILMSASVEGTDASEWLSASDANAVVSAGAGDDEIHAPFGASHIDGGRGFDTFVIYEGTRDDFDVLAQADGSVHVEGKGLNGISAVSKLVNVERISFTDQMVSISEPPAAESVEQPVAEKPQAELPASVQPIANSPAIQLEPSLTANDDRFVIGEDRLVLGNVLLNDRNSSGGESQVSISRNSSSGIVFMGSNGRFGYLKTAVDWDADYFEYTVTNQLGEVSAARVDILESESVRPPVEPAVDVPQLNTPPARVVETPVVDSASPVNVTQLPVVGNKLDPVAGDDAFVLKSGEMLFGNVSTNDADPDGPNYKLKFELVENADFGTLNFYSDGSFDYFADDTNHERDAFRYRVTDADGRASNANVSISLPVLPQSVVPPSSGPQSPAISEPPVDPQSPSVLPDDGSQTDMVIIGESESANDYVLSTTNGSATGELLVTGIRHAAVSMQVIEHTAAKFGTVTVDQDGQFAYQADVGFSGIDYFHYLVGDQDDGDWATVAIHVNPEGKLPTQVNNFITVTPGVATPIIFDLSGDSVINVTGETTGKDKSNITSIGRTVQFDIDADGTLENIEWVDGSGDGILVDTSKFQGTNINGSALFGDEGGKYDNGFIKLAALDTDGNSFLEDGELNSLKLWVDNGDGILQATELQSLQQHDIHSIGIRMMVTDAGLMQSSAFTKADLRILTEDVWFAESEVATPPVDESANFPPDANPDVFTGKRNEAVVGNVLSNDRDQNGDLLSVQKHTRPVHGLLTIDNDGTFTYTPDQNYVGVDYFQYEVSDGRGGMDTAVVMLNVLADTAVIGQPTGHEINGTIWADSNRNGLQDGIETGRASSVFVSLLNEQGAVLESVHSDAAGKYSFDGLGDGTYRIRVSASSLPAVGTTNAVLTLRDVNSNFFDSVDSDISHTTGLSSLIIFGAGQVEFQTTTIDAGYIYA